MAEKGVQAATAVVPEAPASELTLADALEDANLPTLLLVLAQLTGENRWLEDPYRPTPPRGLDDHDTAGLSEELQAEVRAEALKAITAWREGELELGPAPTPERVAEMLEVSLAEEVDREYGDLLAEEMGAASRDAEMPAGADTGELDVAVIGAGMSGICIAIKLSEAGIPFTMIEKNDTVGGTWLENEYPGCAVDTPSHLYSFSFARRSDWSHYFSERVQLRDYFRDLADEHQLDEHVMFGTEVDEARWDAEGSRWLIDIRRADGSTETLRARVLISAVGHFNRPSIPRIKGLDDFAGPCMHTARWDPKVEVEDKTVAIVGTGASAMQLAPSLAGKAKKVLVFQRSRQWCIPHPNVGREVTPKVQYLLENVPFYAGWYRLRQFWRFGDRLHPALQVDPDYDEPEWAVNATNASHRKFLEKYINRELEGHPDLVEASIPDYPAYGKRPLIDHGWYKTIRRDDVELIEGSVSEVRGNTIITSDGREFEADVLALATGFKTLEILGPLQVIGRSGQTIRDTWGIDDARAFLGIAVPEFPNFFMLFGPNTSTGHGGSAFLSTEFQVRYVMEMLALMIEGDLHSVEPTREAFDAYQADVDAALERTVWTHPKVDNYYRNAAGRIVGTSPFSYLEYWNRTRHPDLADYEVKT